MDQSQILSRPDPTQSLRKQFWHSAPSLAATTTIRRLRDSFESWFDNLDFAQWLFVLCITATVLLIRNRLRGMATRLIRLFFEW
jgi:hypothetical protein